MQPGATQVAQTLSWVTVALIVLSVIAGLGVSAIVWILAARTWILERAVTRRTAALQRALKRVRQLAITDELTGLYNRRFFLKRWIWEWERATRYGRPIACLMMDVNKFKDVNDRLGHAAGDEVLRRVARELQRILRQSDILCRFGGDEFIAALPETTQAQAQAVAEKLRKVRVPVAQPLASTMPAVTLSVGVAVLEAGMKQHEDVLEAADRALYEQKRGVPNGSLHSHR
jgi:diguanylate cyclase (GGDEF)-like protein